MSQNRQSAKNFHITQRLYDYEVNLRAELEILRPKLMRCWMLSREQTAQPNGWWHGIRVVATLSCADNNPISSRRVG
jgi:hypothetical protein